jgi:hypothetical protein
MSEVSLQMGCFLSERYSTRGPWSECGSCFMFCQPLFFSLSILCVQRRGRQAVEADWHCGCLLVLWVATSFGRFVRIYCFLLQGRWWRQLCSSVMLVSAYKSTRCAILARCLITKSHIFAFTVSLYHSILYVYFCQCSVIFSAFIHSCVLQAC